MATFLSQEDNGLLIQQDGGGRLLLEGDDAGTPGTTPVFSTRTSPEMGYLKLYNIEKR